MCPPVPGRADYVHYLADLLATDNQGVVPTGKNLRGLDIGTGANVIYPIIATRIYGWQMVGTEIDPVSISQPMLLLTQIQFKPTACLLDTNIMQNIFFLVW